MIKKINKMQGVNLILLLSMLHGNILSMQKSDIGHETQAMEIDQNVQQELYLLNLPAEVIEYILYQIIKPYENSINGVNNIFEFYSQLDLKQLRKDLVGAVRASKGIRLWALDLISKLKTLKEKKYQELVNLIKYQYQDLSQILPQDLFLDELNSRLRNILNQFCVNRNDLEEATKLILSGANTNEKNSWGAATLMLVAREGHKDIAQLLIGNGADVNQKGNYGSTALIWAARFGHKDIVQLLIGNGANVNQKDNDGHDALIWAARRGHKSIVQLLINNGANVNEKNNYENTALMHAVRNGYKGIVELLDAAKNKGN